MGMSERAVVGTAIDGLVVISLKQVDDERGTDPRVPPGARTSRGGRGSRST